jgi:hypothetical protein
MLLAGVEDELHAKANTKKDLSALRATPQRLDEPLLAQARHSVAERADAGQDYCFCRVEILGATDALQRNAELRKSTKQ